MERVNVFVIYLLILSITSLYIPFISHGDAPDIQLIDRYRLLEIVNDGPDSKAINPYDLVGKELPVVKILHEGAVYRLYSLMSGICRCRFTVLGDYTIIDGKYNGVEYRVLKGSNGLAVVGDNGYMYFRLDDGKSYGVKSYEELLNNATNELYNVIGDTCRYFDVIGPDYKLIYYGVSGEEKSEKIIGVEIHPNGTTKTLNKKISEYSNPYDVYYIYISGYRVEPPIIIRGIDPSGTRIDAKVQYLKALIPIAERYKKVKITKSMIDELVNKYISETGGKSSDVYVYDIYLSISSDGNYLLPTIKVKAVNSSIVYWFQITWDSKVEVLASATFTGTSVSHDHYSLMEGDDIINNLEAITIYNPEKYNSNNGYSLFMVIIALILVLGIATSFILFIKHRHTRE